MERLTGDMTVLKANMRHHKGTMIGIGVLLLMIGAALGTVLTVWINSADYIGREMERAGFGELTAWVSGISHISGLAEDMAGLPEIDRVETQSLIFSNYEINGQESDSEGQLITFVPGEGRYRFFTDDLVSYRQEIPDIGVGEIYVSPSLISMFGAELGQEIRFPIARGGRDKIFTVKGFYEDPFMGSSMIGMKGFLISRADREEILSILQNAGINALARDGAMMHIFAAEEQAAVSQLNSLLNEHTALAEYTEFVHSQEAMGGFMLILQNAFGALMLAFVLVLLLGVCVVLWHSMGSLIEADTVNMGILKTIGFTSMRLRRLQCLQYFFPIVAGLFLGLLLAVPAGFFVCRATITSIGIRIPAKLPFMWWGLCVAAILLLLMGFVFWRTGKVGKITPMKAIRREEKNVCRRPGRGPSAARYGANRGRDACCGILGKALYLRLALRQLLTWKRRYAGALLVAAILVFFASLAGRVHSWLGPDGKGMMDAFNPADHDIGVQIFGSLTVEEMEGIIRSYTEIRDGYQLAMPGVSVNGVDYTANVITEPERFHILEGRTCNGADEIVLTEFIAADFGISIGDTVTVQGDRGKGEYLVSGIYSCANDMGDNVGMSREGYGNIGRDVPQIWCRHYFLADSSRKMEIREALEHAFGGDVHVHENTWPGLFGIISAMEALMFFMYGIVAAFILIVTVMTGSRILLEEQRDLGIYKAMGFRTRSLRLAFGLRFCLVAVFGSIAGSILAAAFSDPLVSAVMKLAGISNFRSQPDIGNILLPGGVVTVLFFGFAWILSGKIKKVSLRMLITE